VTVTFFCAAVIASVSGQGCAFELRLMAPP